MKGRAFTTLMFKVCLSFILLAHLTLGISQYLPIEFKSVGIRDDYYSFLFFGTPVAAFLSSILDFIKNHKSRFLLLSLFVGILFGLISIVTVFLVGFSSLDDRTERDVLKYKHRFLNQQIVLRKPVYYGKPKGFKVKPLLPFFQWVTTTDLTNLNPDEWIPQEK